MVLATGGSLSLSTIKSEFYPNDNPVNPYNWYNNVTYSGTGYTPVVTGSDPTSQIQMTDGGTFRSALLNFPNINYQNTEQFTFTFEIYVNGGTGDYLNLNFGSCTFNFQSFSGYSTNGVNFYDCTYPQRNYSNDSGTIAVRTTNATWNVSSWVRVMIVYNKGNVNTWSLYLNGQQVIKYSDPNNARFLSTTPNTMTFTAFNGGAVFTSYLRKFDLRFGLPYTIVNPYTWYTDMSLLNHTGNFTPVVSGSDPNVQIQLSNGTSTNNLQMASYYNEFPVHQDSFVLTFQFYLSGNANNFWISFGDKSPLGMTASNTNAWRIYGNVYTGAGSKGLYLCAPGQGIANASSSYAITWAENTWNTLTIAYTKGTHETWRIAYNGNEFVYSDTANPYWIEAFDVNSNPGNFWGIGNSSNVMNFYIRQVNMTVLPSASSNSQKLFTPLNWYSNLTSNALGSLTYNDPIKWSQLVAGAVNTGGYWSSSNVPIKNYSSLYFTGEMYLNGTGDYFNFNFGDTSANGAQGISIYFNLWNGYVNGSYSGAGVYILKNGAAVAYSPLTFFNQIFVPIQIAYNYSTTNTWVIYYNGNAVLNYSDASVVSWSASSGNYFSAGAWSGGGLQMSAYCRRLQLSYTPNGISISNLTSNGSIAAGLQNSTTGGMAMSSLYNKGASVLTNNSQLAIDNGAYNTSPWGATISDPNTRWLWNTVGATGGNTPGDLLIRCQIQYTNTTNNTISSILTTVCDNLIKVYQNKQLIAPWPVTGGWGDVLQFPPVELTANSTTIAGYGTYTANSSTIYYSLQPYLAFNNSTSDYWGDMVSYSTTGYYTGSFSTTISGVAYGGEWLQIQTPTSQPLVTYKLAGRNDANLWPHRSPNTFVIGGSNDGTTWTLIDSRSGIQDSGGYTTFSCNQNNLNSYTYFRLVIQKIGNDTSVNAYKQTPNVGVWQLYTFNNPIPVIIQPGPNVFEFVGANWGHWNPAGLHFHCASSSGTLFRSDNNSATPLTNSTKTTVSTFNQGYVLPLNNLPSGYTCNGAYALTQVNFRYDGPVVNIRASGGPNTGTSADFYADAQGNLTMRSTSSVYNTIGAFLGSGTGYVVTWYDQSGNGRHATQSTAAYQPIITWNTNENAWCVDSQNSGTQYMNIPSGTVPAGTLNAPYSFIVKHGNINIGGSDAITTFIGAGVNTLNRSNNFSYINSSRGYINWWWGNDLDFTTSYTTGNTVAVTFDGATRRGYVNNTLIASNSTLGGTTATGGQFLFKSPGTEYLNGQMFYAYIFSTNIGQYATGSGALTAIQDTTALTTLYNTPRLSRTNLLGSCLTAMPVLDTISSVSKTALNGAYALVRLSMNYTGATINIRRGSDNATSDFYADIAGNLNTALNGSGTSIQTWLQGSVGYVVTWYDQSGKGNNATQSTAAYQPVLNIIYTVQLTESIYCVDSQNSSTQFLNIPSGTVPVGTLNAPYSFVLRHGNINNVNGGFIGSGTNTTNQSNNLRAFSNAAYTNYWWSSDLAFGTTNQLSAGNQVAITYDGSSHKAFINNTLSNSRSASGATTASGQQYLFKTVIDEYINGQMYYCYIFSSAIPDTDRLKLATV